MVCIHPVTSVIQPYRITYPDLTRGFAIGWDYAISWLVVLPFELIAAGLTIDFWRPDINIGVWITVFLVVLIAIQFFGVRGYGEGAWSLYFLLHTSSTSSSTPNVYADLPL